MSSLLRLCAVIALSACATAGTRRDPGTRPPEGMVTKVHGAEIVVVHEAVDPRTAAEVARALPGAVLRATRWGPLRSARIVVHGSEARFREAVGETGRGSLRAWTRDEIIQLRDPRAWSPFGASEGELEEVLAHELVHCAMNQRLGPPGVPRPGVPFWFREGMAIEPQRPEEERAIRARLQALASWRGAAAANVLSGAAALLSDHPDVAYALAYVAVRTLVDRHGDAVIGRILDRMRGGDGFDTAFVAVTATPLAAFEVEVRGAIEGRR